MDTNIVANNKLIAEFMGGKYTHNSRLALRPNEVWLPIHGIVNATTIELGNGPIMHYHDSWDWLIPVVGKIYDMNDYYNYIKETSGQFENTLPLTTNIRQVYEGVIDYINWHNQVNLSV